MQEQPKPKNLIAEEVKKLLKRLDKADGVEDGHIGVNEKMQRALNENGIQLGEAAIKDWQLVNQQLPARYPETKQEATAREKSEAVYSKAHEQYIASKIAHEAVDKLMVKSNMQGAIVTLIVGDDKELDKALASINPKAADVEKEIDKAADALKNSVRLTAVSANPPMFVKPEKPGKSR